MGVNNKQQGMTLIEVLVAATLSALLLAGVIQIYLSSTQSYRMIEDLARLQESGRFAMDFIARDFRQAGYRACWEKSAIAIPVDGTNNDTDLTNKIQEGTDTLTMQISLTACPVVADSITYSIATGASGQLSLFRRNSVKGKGIDQEWVEGIADMQVLYGEDTSGDNTPNHYVVAGTTGSIMSRVVSIQVHLLAVTLNDNLASQPVPYTFNGITTTPTDKRLRREFIATIALRNQLP